MFQFLLGSVLVWGIMTPNCDALFLGMASSLQLKKCIPLELKVCRQLGYNQTKYSPQLYLSSRRSEVIQYFGLLQLTKCSDDLLFFICMSYQPICFENYDQVIPPCRSVCEHVRDGCLPIINSYGFNWPQELNCEALPDHKTGVCIKPSAIIKNQIHDPEKKTGDNSVLSTKKVTSCPVCPKSITLKRFRNFKRADFAIVAIFQRRMTSADGTTKLTFRVAKVYKSGKVPVPSSGSVQLWSPNSCICPKIQLGRAYVILGQEDVKQNQLLINKKIIMQETTPRLEKKLMKYALKYQYRLRKRLARRLRKLLRSKKN